MRIIHELIWDGVCVCVCVFASCYDDNGNEDTNTVPNEHAYLPFHTILFHSISNFIPHNRNIETNEMQRNETQYHTIQ